VKCKTFCVCWNITVALPATFTLRYSGISQPLCTLRELPSALHTSHGCLEFPMDHAKYNSVVPNISSLRVNQALRQGPLPECQKIRPAPSFFSIT